MTSSVSPPLKTLVYNTHPYDRESLEQANRQFGLALQYTDVRLDALTAQLATGYSAVSAFVNDRLDADSLQALAAVGVKYIALRCAGFNQVDLKAARKLEIKVARVPAYSPYAVAEHSMGLILALNRGIHRAHLRVRDQNFSLNGLLGFDLHLKTVGVIGTGKIGERFCHILRGFGCQILAYDPQPNPACLELGVSYVELPELFARSEIISLHCPLSPATHHLINAQALTQMQPGVMLINTSRGGLLDTEALIAGLKSGKVGALGLDVYEEEEHLFFEDHSGQVLQDDRFARLLTFPNVLITGHQAYFTREALHNIAQTTLENLQAFATTGSSPHEVYAPA